ncbi:hypothetical protein [Streptomyces cavourensis]|nr:hypothetical protein [Streptomyces cavourensis]
MADVLVLVDHVDGAVRKPTLELLTLARLMFLFWSITWTVRSASPPWSC